MTKFEKWLRTAKKWLWASLVVLAFSLIGAVAAVFIGLSCKIVVSGFMVGWHSL